MNVYRCLGGEKRTRIAWRFFVHRRRTSVARDGEIGTKRKDEKTKGIFFMAAASGGMAYMKALVVDLFADSAMTPSAGVSSREGEASSATRWLSRR